jgi:hypothetical protein
MSTAKDALLAEANPGARRRAARFRKTEVTRAAKAAEEAGLTVTGFRITRDGEVEVMTAKPGEASSPPNTWDKP